jgi:hypothetical protein
MIPSAYYAKKLFFSPLGYFVLLARTQTQTWRNFRLLTWCATSDLLLLNSDPSTAQSTRQSDTRQRPGESWGRDCVWDVQSPLFILTARLRRVRRNVEKEKEKTKRPKNSIVWQPVVTLGEIGFPFLQSSCPAHGPLPNATTTNNANQNSPENLSVNVPSAIGESQGWRR